MAAFRRCVRCEEDPVTRCGRCEAALCRTHRPGPNLRCRACERDYQDEGVARNRVKAVVGLPSAAAATAGMFALLFPLGAGLAGAVVIAACAALAGSSTAALVFRAIERSARAQFLREHGLPLPTARVIRLLPRG